MDNIKNRDNIKVTNPRENVWRLKCDDKWIEVRVNNDSFEMVSSGTLNLRIVQHDIIRLKVD